MSGAPNGEGASPRAFPLDWPEGWPRTLWAARSFWRASPPMNLSAAREDLFRELRLLEATRVVLSSNVTLANDHPDDPGVALYFVLRGRWMVMPLDRYTNVVGNLRALTLSIGAMRGLERWGGGRMMHAAFEGFVRLPPTGPSGWRAVLGEARTVDEVQAAFRSRLRSAHADQGGSSEAMRVLIEARAAALKELAA